MRLTKKFFGLVAIVAVLTAALLLSGCDLLADIPFLNDADDKTEPAENEATTAATEQPVPDTPAEDLYLLEISTVYQMARDAGYRGSLEDLVKMFKGEKGDAGADGANGADGATPYIGDNGNWWINGVETYIPAKATSIESMEINSEGHLIVVLTDGTERDLGSIKEPECDHEFGEWIPAVEPTCTSMGYYYRICGICRDFEYDFRGAVGHTFGEGFVMKEPTADEEGAELVVCEVCGTVVLRSIEGTKYSEGLSYEIIEDKEEYRVIDIGTCEDTEINVPEEYEGLPVTEIGEKAFYGYEHIVAVKLPETIQKIGDKAFSECANLEEVCMSDSVEIGLDVFRGSIKVETIYIHTIYFVEGQEPSCYEPGFVDHYYCEFCDEYYEDDEGKIRIYDITIPSSHDFVDGVCTRCGLVQDEILIVDIEEIAHLGKFPLGTLEDAIGLPSEITVYTADGYTHVLPVVWDLSTYNKAVAGEYTINGIIRSPEFRYAEGLSNIVSTGIEVVETMKGTADVVFILDISGSMGDEINNVKENVADFAAAIEAMGVSARWAAITYSDFEDCPGNSREITQIVPNGASQWFTSAAEYEYAFNSIYLAGGGDTPEVAVDGLMYANYELTTRKDARVFYILLTDADYKNDNNYGVSNMAEATEILVDNSVNVSVIAPSGYDYYYGDLAESTGGIMTNIYGDFSSDLIDALVPIIYEEVIA